MPDKGEASEVLSFAPRKSALSRSERRQMGLLLPRPCGSNHSMKRARLIVIPLLLLLSTVAEGTDETALVPPRRPDGDGSVAISGELKQWHKITLTLDGPFAHERDNRPNPFTDRQLTVKFRHESGSPSYIVPGYFAADGDAGNTSADSGTKWRTHLAPDTPGKWIYELTLVTGDREQLLGGSSNNSPLTTTIAKSGSFEVTASD